MLTLPPETDIPSRHFALLKSREPFHRRTTVKSVADPPIGVWYRRRIAARAIPLRSSQNAYDHWCYGNVTHVYDRVCAPQEEALGSGVESDLLDLLTDPRLTCGAVDFDSGGHCLVR
jgi:hypothetical protein